MRNTRIQDKKEQNDLPREKFKKYGASRTSDEELLAILLGSGTKGKNVLSLAREVLRKIRKVGPESITENDLKEIRGLGEIKSQQIAALLALTGRLHTESKKEVLKNRDIWKLCNDFYGSAQEHLAVFYLNTRSYLIRREIVFVGSLNESVAHPRDVFEKALLLNAATIVIVHNHPSGHLSPSEADITITNRFIDAGKVLGITVQDHLIVTADDFLSMRRDSEVEF